MPRLIWSPSALRDVQRLYRFLANKSPDAAKRAVSAIRQGVRILSAQPKIGRLIEDMPDSFREWPIDFGNSGYIARYQIEDDVVVLLSIWHQREAGH